MDKLKMETKSITTENIDFIESRFPNAVIEVMGKNGYLTKKVDFDVLKQELSDVIVGGTDERYYLNWPGKKEAILKANTSVRKTLRPCEEESVNFDNTKNVYIEGDNLNVLKLLRETYLGKIRVIYIDPPYNTGNDLLYEDDFSESPEEYLKETNQIDEEGNRMVQNLESNGRFHSKWLSSIYPRLKLAKDLLSDHGVIFISIDDNELTNLKKICDEIFGERHFVAQFEWMKTSTPPSLSKNVRKKLEYVLCYCKNYLSDGLNGGVIGGGDMPLLNNGNAWSTLRFPSSSIEFRIPDGVYKAGKYDRVVLENDVVIKNGKSECNLVLSGNFKWIQETVDDEVKHGTIFRIKSDKFAIRYEREGERKKVPSNIISKDECGVGTNEDASKEIASLFGSNIMSYPKPSSLIRYLINMVAYDDDIILDFYSGSATTAQAVMQLNAEDGGHRKFIMVQVPEKCAEDSDAYKAGYKNICEIGKERIRRAGKKIVEENPSIKDTLDTGFRVLKLDSSNMKDVYYNPSDYTKDLLVSLEDNIKEDRSSMDLVFQVMLELGISLNSRIGEITISGKNVFVVRDDLNESEPRLICCFDNNITDDVVIEIAKLKPEHIVFRDSSMSSDSVIINVDQIIKAYSPNTKKKVI